MKIPYSILASNVCLIHDTDPEEDLRPKEAIKGNEVMVKTLAAPLGIDTLNQVNLWS